MSRANPRRKDSRADDDMKSANVPPHGLIGPRKPTWDVAMFLEAVLYR
jgi:hypothetical protein